VSLPSPTANERYALATFQQDAVAGLQATVVRVAEYHTSNPEHRREVALKNGAMLLESPTGSGKTLIVGRTLEGLRGELDRKCVWFWFAPYTGLVAQTRETLNQQCAGLRLRDIYTDREPTGTRDGDIYVQTWSAVAAQNKEARTVRRTKEDALSLDDLIADLRSDDFFVGVVIDEAHLNFGASATAAAKFYLEALQPDFTILATATPNDDKLKAFEDKAGIEVASRVVIDRGQVVEAGLNKRGLMLGILRFQDEDAGIIDLEQATLTGAWLQHEAVKNRLLEKAIPVTPLLLVQVEDQQKGGEDPVARVREKLELAGVAADKIKSHTSGEPDPEFHTLAYDPTVEVLIFKVAVATGFDAPRAWTLVSVRPNRGKEFGLQIVGRIMRVHPLVRPIHGQDQLLDRGYVFLTDADLQAGLSAAVDELKAVRHGMDLITDQLDIVQFGNSSSPIDANVALSRITLSERPQSPAERQQRLALLIDAGLVEPEITDHTEDEQDRAILTAEMIIKLGDTPLFGDLPTQLSPTPSFPTGKLDKRYPLSAALSLPKALIREELPELYEISDDLTSAIAREFCQSLDLRAELSRRLRRATLSLRDLFLSDEEQRTFNVRVSNARIAERAQLAFRFNDSIDPRLLKQSLIAELKRICDDDGIEYTIDDLRRTIDIAVMRDPERLRTAVRQALRQHLRMSTSEPIPEFEFGSASLPTAKKAAYGIFPSDLNNEERAFAEFMDGDTTGVVKWWLRNRENTRWATRIVLPTGRRFFPDFVVGVTNRSTPDSIALVEIKDDGVTGRLQADSNIMKIRVQHQEYKNVFWTYRADQGVWARARYDDGLNRIVPQGAFKIAEMVYLT
jgi:type III restriction enzyme